MKLVLGAAASIALISLSASPNAAYCPPTGAPRELAICNDATLTIYETGMKAAYDAALQALPAPDAALLKQQQERWLAYLDKICPATNGDYTDCLTGQYVSRVRALKAAAVKAGPFLIARVDIYETGGSPRGERHAAYPRIVAPETDAQRAWNRLNVRKPESGRCETGREDTDIDYEVHLATTGLISVLWTTGFYCHDAQHPSAVTAGTTMTLSPAPKPATAQDIFLPGSAWSDRLDRAVREGVEKAALEKGETVDPARLDGHAAKPENWILTKDGLVVFFNPRDLGDPRFTPSILVPWSALDGVLRPGLGLPPS